MFDALRRDIRTVFERDPALRSRLEAFFCYPGVHALVFHRVAHRLWGAGWVSTARVLSHFSRFMTGIELHPAPRLGPGLFIDHGMGSVHLSRDRGGGPPRARQRAAHSRAPGQRRVGLLKEVHRQVAEPASPAHVIRRDDAWSILVEFTRSDSLRKHARAVEASMRAYALRYGEDPDVWGIAGMLHDFDYEMQPR